MKKLLFFLIPMIALSCLQHTKSREPQEVETYQKDYWRHLSYLLHLKNEVAQKNWGEFSEKDLFQPAVYYTHDGAFVLNPNSHIRSIAEHGEMKPFGKVERIRLSETYTDTTSFDFSISYSDTDTTALYFKDNVLSFQSFELTKKLIGVSDLQDWSIMVIHELFHGYQRSIPEFKAYYTHLDIPGGPDAFLAKYHKELDWFRESVEAENEALKEIWINGAALVANLEKYDSLRSARIEKVQNDFGVDIREVEDYEICIEGHARYFESLCKRYLSEGTDETGMLTEKDLALITHMFEGYQIKQDKGLYDIYNDRYYYQLGYNISMILEKHLPAYKASIYTREFNFNRYLELLTKNERP